MCRLWELPGAAAKPKTQAGGGCNLSATACCSPDFRQAPHPAQMAGSGACDLAECEPLSHPFAMSYARTRRCSGESYNIRIKRTQSKTAQTDNATNADISQKPYSPTPKGSQLTFIPHNPAISVAGIKTAEKIVRM